MADPIKLAVAQVPSIKGDVPANMGTHVSAVQKAAAEGVSYIVFPELSLTGYEPRLARELAFSEADPRLAPLRDAAAACNIHIVAGAPLKRQGLPHIGEFIFFPDGRLETYAKMNLHPGEETWFSPGETHHFVHLGRHKIFNAICADTNHDPHMQACARMGATVYMAGVLIGETGYGPDTEKLADHSNRYGCLVAMANHNSPTGGWLPVGKSAIWYGPRLIAAADSIQSALVTATDTPHGWTGKIVDI